MGIAMFFSSDLYSLLLAFQQIKHHLLRELKLLLFQSQAFPKTACYFAGNMVFFLPRSSPYSIPRAVLPFYLVMHISVMFLAACAAEFLIL
jgi:hypothetical protein